MLHFLYKTIHSISPIDNALSNKAQKHLDNLTKPQGSLGYLEDVAKKIYCIQGAPEKIYINRAHIFTVAADHGIALENVSAYPQEVTRQMVLNFLADGAAINVLCRLNNIDFSVVDAGCVGGAFPTHEKLIDKRLGEGTSNFAKEAAMNRDTCIRALCYGIELAEFSIQQGANIIGIGEMGIGNTTSATALFCALYGLDPQLITGPGAGASKSLIAHKAKVIEKALEFHSHALSRGDALDTLSILGGFEIAVMAGIALGVAKHKCILMVDGFISTAAFAVAKALCPAVQDYAILSHFSAEPGYMYVVKKLESSENQFPPLLHLKMCLGEGTGAALAIPIVRAAASIFNDMATFSSAKISGEIQ